LLRERGPGLLRPVEAMDFLPAIPRKLRSDGRRSLY